MPRTMADATHINVTSIPSGVPLVAGYVTGTPDIQWTAADWALFGGSVHVTIDQGGQGSPVLSAIVRDVETGGAWAPGQAVDRTGWSAARPTIYCTLEETGYGLLTNPGVLADGWQGDLWLAIPNWQPGQPLPATPGCNIVAVQNVFTTDYDLSVVLDPAWPAADLGDDMKILTIDRASVPAGVNWPGDWLLRGDGTVRHIQTMPELTAYQNCGLPTVTISYTDWAALAGVQ